MAKRRTQTKIPPVVWAILAVLTIATTVVIYQTWHTRYLIERQASLSVSSKKKKKAEALAKKKAFIKRIAPLAQQNAKAYNVMASVTIAQAILESNFGQSTLASKYHNLFGVKGTDPATTKELTTQEYVNDQWVTVTGRFRVYESDAESVRAHALLFVNGTTWNKKQYAAVLAATDYQTAARALQTSGYATDPTYPEKLIALIKEWNLTQYD